MRIAAINSFLSTAPIVDTPTVSRVKRDDTGQTASIATSTLSQERFVDTIGRAVARTEIKLVESSLAPHEIKLLLALIQKERARTDHIKTWFPSLLKV